jgi:DNA-binding PadR family transcriptional regulator
VAAKPSSSCPGRIRLRHLQPLCLALLARQPGSGYDVMAALSALPLFAQTRPDAPGVYRTLQGLERRGLIHARRRPSKVGPPRREYTLAPAAGRACLANWAKLLLAARGEIDAVIALVQQGRKGATRAAGQRSHKPVKRQINCRSAAPQRDAAKPSPARNRNS